jgi:hypothetical protein
MEPKAFISDSLSMASKDDVRTIHLTREQCALLSAMVDKEAGAVARRAARELLRTGWRDLEGSLNNMQQAINAARALNDAATKL